MRFSSAFVALVAPLLASAAPARIYGRDPTKNEVLVFQFADLLEQAENTFYQQALSKFQQNDFTSAGFTTAQIPIEQFKVIQQDEATHSKVLQSALKSFGAQPITNCKFNFNSALTDVKTMAAVARVVENVGVSAYLGGATLLSDPVLLTSAASILTVEARHQSILNVLSGSGSAIPAAFDIALTPSEILALVTPFFDGPCNLPIPANPVLSITNQGTPAPGTRLTFQSSAINGSTNNFHCQMMVGGAEASISLPFDQCVVPSGINGPVAIWVTSDAQPLANNVHDRATTQLIAGPTYAFIDTQPELLGQMARGNGGQNNQGVSSTRTISPAEASSIISKASSTPVVLNGGSSPAPTGSASNGSSNNGSSNGSSASPSSSGSAASPSASGGAAKNAPALGQPGGPSSFTGLSPDGAVTVNGWKNL